MLHRIIDFFLAANTGIHPLSVLRFSHKSPLGLQSLSTNHVHLFLAEHPIRSRDRAIKALSRPGTATTASDGLFLFITEPPPKNQLLCDVWHAFFSPCEFSQHLLGQNGLLSYNLSGNFTFLLTNSQSLRGNFMSSDFFAPFSPKHGLRHAICKS